MKFYVLAALFALVACDDAAIKAQIDAAIKSGDLT